MRMESFEWRMDSAKAGPGKRLNKKKSEKQSSDFFIYFFIAVDNILGQRPIVEAMSLGLNCMVKSQLFNFYLTKFFFH